MIVIPINVNDLIQIIAGLSSTFIFIFGMVFLLHGIGPHPNFRNYGYIILGILFLMIFVIEILWSIGIISFIST